MYNVSSEYLNAISQPVRTFKIEARFNYKNAAQAVFDDSSIMGEAMIESQAVSGSASCGIIDIGAVPSTTASLTIIDNEAGLKKYVGSSFTIRVSLLLENGEYEDVPMGTFYCDSAKTSRTGNRISVFGYDAMVTFKYTLTDAQRSSLTDKTPQAAVSILTESAKCDFNQDLSGFPNSDLQLDFSNTQVVTGWDGIMWIAQLMGCFARINRQNYLEFVPIKSTWESDTMVSVRNITGAERYRTTFSDDRIHIVGVSMPDANNNLVTRSAEISADDSNVTIALEKNPLIKSTYALEDILNNILSPLQTAYFYAFRSEIINDPALDVGDTVRLQGGEINGIPNNELVGFITHNTWRYRGRQEIVNTGQTTDTAAEHSENAQFYAQPKSQSDKLLDSLSGSTSQLQERVTVIEKGGAGQRDRIIASNGNAWVARPAFSGGRGGHLVCFDTSNECVAEINASTNLHPYQYEDKMPRYNGGIQIQSIPGISLQAKTTWGSESTQNIGFKITGDYIGHGVGITADSIGGLSLWGSAPLPWAKILPGTGSSLSFELHITPDGKATITIHESDLVGSIDTTKKFEIQMVQIQ